MGGWVEKRYDRAFFSASWLLREREREEDVLRCAVCVRVAVWQPAGFDSRTGPTPQKLPLGVTRLDNWAKGMGKGLPSRSNWAFQSFQGIGKEKKLPWELQ